MEMSDLLNVRNLQTARENAGLSTRAATKKVSSAKKDLVAQWEQGASLPTLRQLEALAKQYQVSPLLLLSSRPIDKNRVIPDFRTTKKTLENKDKLHKLINLVIKRQAWLNRKLQAAGYNKNNLVGSGANVQSSDALAAYIVKKLGISYEKIVSFSGDSGKEKTLKYLTELLESKQIFVGKTLSEHRIPVEEMRGMFINHKLAPFIVINRKDAVAAQIFTLMHETAHLFRATEGISAVDFRTLNKPVAPKEEIFCNQVAAAILIPKEHVADANYGEEEVRSLAAHLNVSELFAFYRLKSLGKIIKTQQKELEKLFSNEAAEKIKQKVAREQKQTGGSYVNNMRDSNGNLFNRIVQSFYAQNDISYTEASNVLKFSAEQV